MYNDCSETLIVHPLKESNSTEVMDDTYDHLLNVVHRHDSIMAFYYMNDEDKVRFAYICDSTLK